MRVEADLERFAENARARLRPQTIAVYKTVFRGFAGHADLEGIDKRRLKGKAGKKLLLAYLDEKVPLKSRRTVLAELKTVWTLGLDLPWPIDPRRDIGRLPKTGRAETPPDATVKAWDDALVRDPDPYNRLAWLLVGQHGWRPSHLERLRWDHVKRDADGNPYAIQADGADAGFKTHAPIAARLAPDIAEAINAWRKKAPDTSPGAPLLPYRTPSGKPDARREMGKDVLLRRWRDFQARYGLPPLTPKQVRHWVASACREAGLSRQASAYLMGHDPTAGGAMRDWYDNPGLEPIFAEQVKCLPYGALGKLRAPQVRLAGGDLPEESLEILRAFFAGKMGAYDLGPKLEAVRMKTVPVSQA